jgi:transcriptional regulator with XRE-family HTH domain
MILQDRKRLARLMVIQGVTQRELAEVAGWKAHSILGRLLSGKLKTLTPERAVRIAHHLGVGVEDLFLTRVDSVTGRIGQRSGRAA